MDRSLRARMRELGWVEGRNLAIEYRWADGRTERLSELASDLVRLKVDVIVTHNTPGPLAAKQATSTIPIVFATAGDPLGTGIVASRLLTAGSGTFRPIDRRELRSADWGIADRSAPGS
jgi:putative ABC transport system substrate-binding protein